MRIPAVPKQTSRLPVLRTSWETYRYFFRHMASFAKLAWVPLILLVAVRVFAELEITQPTLFGALSYQATRWAAPIIILALTLVKWHQFVLLGPFRRGHFEAFKLGRPEFLFLAVGAALFCLTTLAPNAFAGLVSMSFGDQIQNDKIQIVLSFLIRISILFLFFIGFVRFFILLPTVAIGRPASISGALATTRGNTFRIFAILCLTSGFLATLIRLVLTYLSEPFVAWWVHAYPDVNPFEGLRLIVTLSLALSISTVTTFLAGGLGATALSLCFRHLKELEKPMTADGNGPATENP